MVVLCVCRSTSGFAYLISIWTLWSWQTASAGDAPPPCDSLLLLKYISIASCIFDFIYQWNTHYYFCLDCTLIRGSLIGCRTQKCIELIKSTFLQAGLSLDSLIQTLKWDFIIAFECIYILHGLILVIPPWSELASRARCGWRYCSVRLLGAPPARG